MHLEADVAPRRRLVEFFKYEFCYHLDNFWLTHYLFQANYDEI